MALGAALAGQEGQWCALPSQVIAEGEFFCHTRGGSHHLHT